MQRFVLATSVALALTTTAWADCDFVGELFELLDLTWSEGSVDGELAQTRPEIEVVATASDGILLRVETQDGFANLSLLPEVE